MERAEHIRDWLWQLAARVLPSMHETELTGRINLLAADLAEEFSAAAFTHASMLRVARCCGRYFPNFAEVCEPLAAWWKEGQTEREYAARYDRLPPPAQSREPYDPGPAPDWCFEGGPRFRKDSDPQAKPEQVQANYLTRAELNEQYRRDGLKGPVLPAQADAEVVALRNAAQRAAAEVKRGPVIKPPP